MYHYIKMPAVFMYKEPRTEPPVELVSQAFYAEQVHLLEEQGKWYRIETIADGYQGWVLQEALHTSKSRMVANAIVNRPAAHLYDQPELLYGPSLTLPYESTLQLLEAGERWCKIKLLDGSCKFLLAGDLLAEPKSLNVAEACQLSMQFLGLPYTWGGRSGFGYDCSGFVQMLYRRMGLSLPRDSKDQFLSSLLQPIEIEQLQAGDLLFFGHSSSKICHVGFCLGAGQFIHTSTAYPSTPYLRINSLTEKEWNGQGYFRFLAGRGITSQKFGK
jgi:SH3-like domain-containing protein